MGRRFAGSVAASHRLRISRPTTGLRVQGWTADDPTEHSDGMYESVTCHACGQVHLLNPKTGKTLGAEPRNE
jgi:hypothetical protein